MANRIPLILDIQDENRIKELPIGDNLNLSGSSIVNVTNLDVEGNLNAPNIRVNWDNIINKPSIPEVLLDLQIDDGNSGQVLSTDGNGSFRFVDPINVELAVGKTSQLENDTGFLTAADIKNGVFEITNTGDLIGSVFAEDSTLLVDAVSGTIDYNVLVNTPLSAIEFLDATPRDEDFPVQFFLADPDGYRFKNLSITDLGITDGTAGQILLTDGEGFIGFGDFEVGIDLVDLSVTTEPEFAPNASLVYDQLTGVFTFTRADLSLDNVLSYGNFTEEQILVDGGIGSTTNNFVITAGVGEENSEFEFRRVGDLALPGKIIYNGENPQWIINADAAPDGVFITAQNIDLSAGAINLNTPNLNFNDVEALNFALSNLEDVDPYKDQFDNTPPKGDWPNGLMLVWNTGEQQWQPRLVNTSFTVQDEGVSLSGSATALNFVGAGVTASGTGSTKTITISGGGGGEAYDQSLNTTDNVEFNDLTVSGTFNYGDTIQAGGTGVPAIVSATNLDFEAGNSINFIINGQKEAFIDASGINIGSVVSGNIEGDVAGNVIAPTIIETPLITHNPAESTEIHIGDLSNGTSQIDIVASTINITSATNLNLLYTPTTTSDWDGTEPTTVGEALDRLATLVKTLNGGTGA